MTSKIFRIKCTSPLSIFYMQIKRKSIISESVACGPITTLGTDNLVFVSKTRWINMKHANLFY